MFIDFAAALAALRQEGHVHSSRSRHIALSQEGHLSWFLSPWRTDMPA